jgi:hypothetical protein
MIFHGISQDTLLALASPEYPRIRRVVTSIAESILRGYDREGQVAPLPHYQSLHAIVRKNTGADLSTVVGKPLKSEQLSATATARLRAAGRRVRPSSPRP